jgi:hypothetical protein
VAHDVQKAAQARADNAKPNSRYEIEHARYPSCRAVSVALLYYLPVQSLESVDFSIQRSTD